MGALWLKTDSGLVKVSGGGDPENHAQLTNVQPDQHHSRYTDAEAVTAVGPHFSGDHADLTNVLTDQHHTKYTDGEAVAAGVPVFVSSPDFRDMVQLTQAAYDGLTPDPDTLYVIVG